MKLHWKQIEPHHFECVEHNTYSVRRTRERLYSSHWTSNKRKRYMWQTLWHGSPSSLLYRTKAEAIESIEKEYQ
jgi:hypothetical protein